MNTSQVQSSYSVFGVRVVAAVRVTLLAVIGVLLLIAAGNSAAGDTTPVCHLPPGNSGNAQLIDVGSKGNAVSAHLSHGDYLPIPEICDDGLDNDCDGFVDDSDPDCPSPVSCPCESMWNDAIAVYEAYPGGDTPSAPEFWKVCLFSGDIVTMISSGDTNAHSDTEETDLVIGSWFDDDVKSCFAGVSSDFGGEWIQLFQDELPLTSNAEMVACVELQGEICGEPRYDPF